MIAVLLSGTGRSLVNLIDCGFKDLIAWVGTHPKTANCKGVEYAISQGIKTISTEEVFEFARISGVELIVLAGYIQKLIIPSDYEGKVINIHPSLLPSFGGKGMYGMNVHKAVIESGVKVSGCTVHYVTNEYDKGPIILQRVVFLENEDTFGTLANKVFEEEKIALPHAINLHLSHKLIINENRVLWRE